MHCLLSVLAPCIVFFYYITWMFSGQNFTNFCLHYFFINFLLDSHGSLDTVNGEVCLSICHLSVHISFHSLSHKLASSFSVPFYIFLPYLSINAFIYLCIAVSDDEHPAQCLVQAGKVYGCVMECSAQQPGSDVNKLIFWQIKKD